MFLRHCFTKRKNGRTHKEMRWRISSTEVGGYHSTYHAGCFESSTQYQSEFYVGIINHILNSILKFSYVQISPSFICRWNDRVHGKTSEPFWIWVEDPESNFMYHSEYFFMTRKQVLLNYVHFLRFLLRLESSL